MAGDLTISTINGGAIGVKNRIINGDMRISQRGTSAVTTSGSFPVDRFVINDSTDGAFSAQQDSSAPVGFTTSLKYTTTTADASLTGTQNSLIVQTIEGLNCSDLAWGTVNAQPVTLSFWVRSSLTGTFGGSFRSSTSSNRSYPFSYSISAANTWEKKSVTIAGDTTGTWSTDNGVGIRISFSMGASPDRSGTAGVWSANNDTSVTDAVSVIGTLNATWQLTGVQLEAGSVATLFERRQYGQELALCQRYYWQQTAAEQGNKYFSFGGAQSSSSIQTMISMPVTMRADPTVTASSFQAAGFGATPTAISGTAFNGNSLRVGLTVSGALGYSVGTVGFDVTLNSEL